MGMYTELHYNVELRKDVPDEVIAVLQHMLDGFGTAPPPLPDHRLFRTTRWPVLFTMDSAYFAAKTHSELFLAYGHWHLNVRSNLKNYDAEIEAFIDWIDPYIAAAPGDFLGFYRYEESEDPTLIRKLAASGGSDA